MVEQIVIMLQNCLMTRVPTKTSFWKNGVLEGGATTSDNRTNRIATSKNECISKNKLGRLTVSPLLTLKIPTITYGRDLT